MSASLTDSSQPSIGAENIWIDLFFIGSTYKKQSASSFGSGLRILMYLFGREIAGLIECVNVKPDRTRFPFYLEIL